MQTINKILICLFVVTSTSCVFDETLTYDVPPELQYIVDDFISDGLARGKDYSYIRTCLVIRYEKDFYKEGYKGYCNSPGQQIYIRLDEDYNRYNIKYHPMRVKGLIYHELGHGVLHRGHNNNFSLMGWGTEFCDDPNDPKWQILVDELFS